MADVVCHPEEAKRPKRPSPGTRLRVDEEVVGAERRKPVLVGSPQIPLFDLLRDELSKCGLFGESSSEIPWRLSSEPFSISPEQMEFFLLLGQDLLEFYRAVDELVLDSSCGKLPSWVLNYLMLRIDAPVKEMGLSKAMRGQTVRVIRPDIILTKDKKIPSLSSLPLEGGGRGGGDGFTITELDSVPGGIGWTAALNAAYEKAGFDVVGAGGQMEKGFARMLADVVGVSDPYWGIVVSEESKAYWHEMTWLGKRLESLGHPGEVLGPEELKACHGKICASRDRKFDVLYRFFELFDHRSIPTWDLMVYAIKNDQVRMTPPIKSYLEEKMLFALFHHPCLKKFWQDHLGVQQHERLGRVFPKTWILDPQPLPPQAVLADLTVHGKPIQRWEELFDLTQRQRRLVIKPSGYSPLAWGSRGVTIGHDQPADRWARLLQSALENFQTCPYILQKYHDPRRVSLDGEEGRVRLCPYYMVYDGKAHLSGILATICPLDKKLIHGMSSAVMAPCHVI